MSKSLLIKNIVRSMMYISSFCPLYILLCIKLLSSLWIIDENNQKVINYNVIIVNSILIVLIIISIVTVYLFISRKGQQTIEVLEVSKTGDSIISYIMTYLIPLLALDINDIYDVIVNVLLFILIGFLYVRLSLIYINPLLALVGFTFYESDRGIVITDMGFSELKNNKKRWRCSLIGDYIRVIRKRDNI